MTTWQVEWKDSKGWHTISYSSASAVVKHVEYCLKHGWTVRNIHVIMLAIPGNAKSRCIFPSRPHKGKRMNYGQDILDALKECGEMTPLEIADRIGSEYRSDRVKADSVRGAMYRLRNKGLVEQVPDTKPIKWRVTE